jgi:hypothetical protein
MTDAAFGLFDDSDDEASIFGASGEACPGVNSRVAREQALTSLLDWLREDPFFTLSKKVEFVVDDHGNVSAIATQVRIPVTIRPPYALALCLHSVAGHRRSGACTCCSPAVLLQSFF